VTGEYRGRWIHVLVAGRVGGKGEGKWIREDEE